MFFFTMHTEKRDRETYRRQQQQARTRRLFNRFGITNIKPRIGRIVHLQKASMTFANGHDDRLGNVGLLLFRSRRGTTRCAAAVVEI